MTNCWGEYGKGFNMTVGTHSYFRSYPLDLKVESVSAVFLFGVTNGL